MENFTHQKFIIYIFLNHKQRGLLALKNTQITSWTSYYKRLQSRLRSRKKWPTVVASFLLIARLVAETMQR